MNVDRELLRAQDIKQAISNIREWREAYGHDIAWHKIFAIGNILRHVYRDIDHMILWEIYTDHLDPVEAAIDAMIAAHGPIPRPPPRSP